MGPTARHDEAAGGAPCAAHGEPRLRGVLVPLLEPLGTSSRGRDGKLLRSPSAVAVAWHVPGCTPPRGGNAVVGCPREGSPSLQGYRQVSLDAISSRWAVRDRQGMCDGCARESRSGRGDFHPPLPGCEMLYGARWEFHSPAE